MMLSKVSIFLLTFGDVTIHGIDDDCDSWCHVRGIELWRFLLGGSGLFWSGLGVLKVLSGLFTKRIAHKKRGPLVLGNGGIYMNAGSGNITSIYLRPSLEIQRSADEMTFLPEERASTMGTESPLEGKHPSVSRARVGTAFLICTTNPHTTHPSLLFIN